MIKMAYVGESEMTDLSSTSGSSEAGASNSIQMSSQAPTAMASALDLAHHLGQVSLDSSPVLTAKSPKFARKYSLRELEIQQTIGMLASCVVWEHALLPFKLCLQPYA